MIQIPQLAPSQNRAGTSIPYQLILSIMEGNISPFLVNIQASVSLEHPSFLKTLISLIAVAVVVILAIPSGGTSMLGLGFGLGQQVASVLALTFSFTETVYTTMIIAGVLAGLIDAAIQGVLVGFGVKEFSLSEALSAGFAAMGSGLVQPRLRVLPY